MVTKLVTSGRLKIGVELAPAKPDSGMKYSLLAARAV